MAIVTLGTNVTLLLILAFTKPRSVTMFDRMAGSTNFGSWNSQTLSLLALILMVQLGVAIVGSYLNFIRHHRKRDRYSFLLIFSFFVSVVGLMVLFV